MSAIRCASCSGPWPRRRGPAGCIVDRRGPGHGARRLSRADARGRPARLPRGLVRARLEATAASCRPSGTRPRPWPRSRPTTCPRCVAGSRPGHPLARAAGPLCRPGACGSRPPLAGARCGPAAGPAARQRPARARGRRCGPLGGAAPATRPRRPRRWRPCSSRTSPDELEQPNLPGTIEEHPNWRRRYWQPVDEATRGDLAARLLGAMAEERPR